MSRSVFKHCYNLSKTYFNIYLVRHGETDENKTGIIQGQRNTKLSSIGIEQAHQLGKRLADIKFTHAYSSDLDRAYETTESILSENHYSTVDIVTDKLLRERKFGEAEGKLRKDLLASLGPNAINLQEFTPKGAETTLEVHHRAVKFFENLCNEISSSKNFDFNESVENEAIKFYNESLNRKIIKLQSLSIHKNADDENIGLESLSSSLNSLNSLEECSIYKNCNRISEIVKQTNLEERNTETPSSGFLTADEQSASPPEETISEVLVVSHGALIRELLKYFVLELKCEFEYDHSILKQVPVNTALSKFTVQLNSNQKELPKINCHLFNDKEHLSNTHLERKTLCNM